VGKNSPLPPKRVEEMKRVEKNSPLSPRRQEGKKYFFTNSIEKA